MGAQVVGSNPTRSIFINLGNYGIELSLFFNNCQTKSLAMPDGKTWKNITTVILRIDYFWSIVSYSYSYHLVVVLSFFFFLSFSSSSSLSSAGVPVLVTRCCSFSSSCSHEILVSIWEISHITIFFFMVCCRVAGLAYCLSLLLLVHCGYSMKSWMVTISAFAPTHQ